MVQLRSKSNVQFLKRHNLFEDQVFPVDTRGHFVLIFNQSLVIIDLLLFLFELFPGYFGDKVLADRGVGRIE